MRFPAFLLPLLVLASTSCSQQTDLAGKWKNGNGETLALNADSTAVLGMEGVDGGINGRYDVIGDTVLVTTESDVDDLGKYHNVYRLAYVEPGLQLVSVTLYRGGDYESVIVEELARKLQKSVEQYRFSRVME